MIDIATSRSWLRRALVPQFLVTIALGTTVYVGCAASGDPEPTDEASSERSATGASALPAAQYQPIDLVTDQPLSDNEKTVVALLIEAAREMDDVYWEQAYGDPQELLSSVSDPEIRRSIELNFGPWDRLDADAPFVPGAGPKPPGANFYPADMSREDFEAAVAEAESAGDEEKVEALRGLYTLIRRGPNGDLVTVPYSQAFAEPFGRAASRLEEAAAQTENAAFAHYLKLRAEALRSDDYYDSDLAWMEMTDNKLDLVIGPIETYEDQLFGYKASAEAFVLVKDLEWSERLDRYAAYLPDLQRGLPVPESYRAEMPGSNAQLNAYDVVYVGGDANSGSKTIAINLPNDERVQLAHGTRRLQLKNAMRAKFDAILEPIADLLIDPEQRPHVTFDAFFANTMFHEVAHGLGIKNTLDGSSTVRQSLREHASALEEGKADVLGLYMVSSLMDRGEETGDLHDNQVTFVASIFRSIRFGTSSAHGKANLIRFNYFAERDAFVRDPQSGTYRIDFEKLAAATDALSAQILRFQGDGDYAGVAAFVERYASVGEQLGQDLARLADAGIPVDIQYRQGPEVLGL